MGRLTKTYEDGNFYFSDDLLCCENTWIFKDILCSALAAYEDATHTEDGTEILTVEEIAELAKAKQEGRLVVLPCKIGATLYDPIIDFDGKDMVADDRRFDGVAFYSHSQTEFCPLSDIGKTVFLTREEAKKALEDMK